ncbi:MAG: ammonium transporter [Coxiellaceae bacterium]|nr:ammonium transporter [Coxiellaceae bacterium]
MSTKRLFFILALLLLLPLELLANTASVVPTLAKHISNAHLFWILICGILVIFMTIPGIAIFYGGLVYRANVLSVYTQCLAMASLASIVWVLIGFHLSFGTGDFKIQLMLGNLSLFSSTAGSRNQIHLVNSLTDLFYQMGFAMITVVIIIGGFAERMKLSASLLFAPLWIIIVYCPIAHWVWGGGWLQQLGSMDFAGGTVVHMNAGIAGLIAAIMIGERKHKSNPHYSLSVVTIGTSILWIGWFGFNGGSAHTLKGTVIALINTQIAPAAAALSWLITERLHNKKSSARGLLYGVISGLVVITPMAGYCSLICAIIVGLISSPVCYFAINMKKIFGYDDALDAFGIHGIAGMLGALLTGITVSKSLGGVGTLNSTIIGQLGAQLSAIITVLLWSGCCTFIILWGIKKTVGLRVPEIAESEGLDLHQHGEIVAHDYADTAEPSNREKNEP